MGEENLHDFVDTLDPIDDYIDNDDVSDQLDELDEDLLPEEGEASPSQEVVFDYSFQETTNQYLFVLCVLFVTFLCIYVFNQIKNWFDRIGG